MIRRPTQLLTVACILLFVRTAAGQGDLTLVAALEESTIAAIDKAEKSVVAIARIPKRRGNTNRARSNPLSLNLPLALDNQLSDPDFVPSFYGSGVVISSDGYILTCAHVLSDPNENDYVVWLNQRSYLAKQVSPARKADALAADAFSDLAVLKIDAENLTPISFAKPDRIRKGRFVVALGNPDAIARDGVPSASWGIISNLSRVAPSNNTDRAAPKTTIHEYGTLIQTDAKLNFGTSGGALVDLQGNMLGLTTSLVASSSAEHSAGFTLAVDELFLRVIEQLKLGKLPDYGFLGIQPAELRMSDRDAGKSGALVSLVLPGLPGERAGLRAEDIIVEVNGKKIYDRDDLFRELSVPAAGEEVKLRVHRYSGRNTPRVLELTAQLSKKPMQHEGRSFASNPTPSWRGLEVDYWTAVSSETNRLAIPAATQNQIQIAVSSLDPDTPAWSAGIRAGCGVLQVEDVRIKTPEDFFKAVEDRSGEIRVEILQLDGKRRWVKVPAEIAAKSNASAG